MDFSQTFDKLKLDFSNNNRGAIRAQNDRNLIESVFQYGGLRVRPGEGSDEPQTIGTTFEPLTQFVGLSPPSSSDVVPNAENGTIEILRGGVYAINLSMCFSGSNNSKWEGSVFRKGIDLGICTFIELLRPSGDVSHAAGFDPLVVKAGDILQYRVRANQANRQILVESCQFFVFRIG